MKRLFLAASLLCLIVSCGNDDNYVPIESNLDDQLKTLLTEASEGKGLSYFMLPESDDYTNIPQDPKNLITKAKVDLGKLLLHETALGRNPKIEEMRGTYSCASCHQVGAGFSAGVRQGIGECGVGFGIHGEERTINQNVPVDSVDIQPLRSPTILNVAYQDVMLWNGQFGGTGTNQGTEANWENIQENFLGLQGVEVQAIKGQGVHRLLVDEDFVNETGYKAMFDAAFGDIAEGDRYTTLNAALAMAAYERTLLANQAPWQEWLKGQSDAMTDAEKRGAIAFFGNGKCYECHTGPALNDKGFYAFGMGDFDNSNTAIVLDENGFQNVKKGRGGFTKNPDDDYKFKTPTLYNIADNGFYGHGSTFTSVKEVVRYKNDGVPQSNEVPAENLATQFGTTDLTDQEIDDLTVFIENSLRDPNLTRYVPETINSGLCFPNNDEQSRSDLGCN
ncbi:cytochrome-c peroxidase [Aquimarina spongiae]|uniref:Cytochrome c peroxidase n=1 Tax=Aquimarina spongiae TaxID=570521 RepID=A0A1M6FFQ2_9FLAO|nr:cytochrome c peroxidase [Aquimarina spongiae]SHI96476.1 cytochrome c peroxidase [Aquimarina spongiae]